MYHMIFSEPHRTSGICTVLVVEPVLATRTSSLVEGEGWATPGRAMTTPPATRPDSPDNLSLLLISD